MASDIESADGNHALEAGERVLTADQADKIAPTVPEDSLEAGFAKIGGKKVRGATPKPSAEPDADAFQEVGGKFVGKAPERADAGQPTAPASAPAEISSVPEDSPFYDAAARILNTSGQHLDIGTKGDLWQHYAESKTPQELAQRISMPDFAGVGDNIKHELFTAKAAAAAPKTPTDKIVDAITRMAQMASTPQGKQMLATAEKHPNVLRSLTSDKG
jgi:hypothetical protein